jgi:hypothetical protein
LVPLAAGMVIPGVQAAPPVTTLQVDPMLVVEPAQFEPAQQTLGCEACGVHVRPGAQPPVESQRQPCVPTMHVEVIPLPLEPLLVAVDEPPDEPVEPVDVGEVPELDELLPLPLAVPEFVPEPFAFAGAEVPQADAVSHAVTCAPTIAHPHAVLRLVIR